MKGSHGPREVEGGEKIKAGNQGTGPKAIQGITEGQRPYVHRNDEGGKKTKGARGREMYMPD